MSNSGDDYGPLAFLGFVVLIILIAVGMYLQSGSDNKTIVEWAAGQSCSVVSVEQTWLDTGPFWLNDEDDRIYKVVVCDREGRRRIAYFRFRWLSHEQEWSR